MKKFTICGLGLLASMFILCLSVHAAEYNVDGKKSSVTFVGTKPGGKHTGGFKSVIGKMTVENKVIKGLEVTIDTRSMYSDNDKLTQHLKSPDFFNVAKYPEAKFVAEKITAKQMSGKLTILGVTKDVTVPLKIGGSASAVEIQSAFTVDRTLFGMTYGQGKVDNTVPVTISLTLVK